MRRLGIAAAAVELAIIFGSIPLAARTDQLSFGAYWAGVALAVPFAVVGGLVALRRPELRMGWLMLAVPAIVGLGYLTQFTAILAYHDHVDVPLAGLSVILQPTWPALIVIPLTIVLYPDGRAPSPRWRWPLRLAVAVAVLASVAAIVVATQSVLGNRVSLGSDGTLNRLYNGGDPVWSIGAMLSILSGVGLLVAWVIRQVREFPRLAREQKAQQKWIIAGATIAFVCQFTLISNSSITNYTALGLATLPCAMGVGILRYRLYEIDRIISRTLSYAIVTALLVGTFVGLVVLSTRVLPFSSTVGVAASTLAAAALFNPLRVRVQRRVDRRFNRARYDAEATVAAFASRLRDAVDIEAVQRDLLVTVQRAVEPSHATVWTRERR